MAEDLTPQEARDAINAFISEISEEAFLEINLQVAGPLYRGYFRPEGHSGDVYAFIRADTYRDVIAGAREKWAELADAHNADMVRRLALKIIELTADVGECTDAGLRAHFDAGDIERFAERAVARANQMAANGPFSIVTLAGANSAQAA